MDRRKYPAYVSAAVAASSLVAFIIVAWLVYAALT